MPMIEETLLDCLTGKVLNFSYDEDDEDDEEETETADEDDEDEEFEPDW